MRQQKRPTLAALRSFEEARCHACEPHCEPWRRYNAALQDSSGVANVALHGLLPHGLAGLNAVEGC